jgi:hypothetical protein
MWRIPVAALAALMLFVPTDPLPAATLPSRDPLVVIPLLRQITARDNFARIDQILGRRDLDDSTEFIDAIYQLTDASSIEVKASLDGTTIYYIHHRINYAPDGVESLYERP